MTRRISLIIGIAVAALTVGVPTAFGEGRLAGSQEPDAVTYFKANELATIGQSVEPGWLKALRIRSEGLQRLYGGGESTAVTTIGQRVEPGWLKALRIRGEGLQRLYGGGENTTASLSGYREAGERAVPTSGSPVVQPIDSGNQLEWPQIGVAFGVGILLAVGLVLTFRHMRIRPLAH